MNPQDRDAMLRHERRVQDAAVSGMVRATREWWFWRLRYAWHVRRFNRSWRREKNLKVAI